NRQPAPSRRHFASAQSPSCRVNWSGIVSWGRQPLTGVRQGQENQEEHELPLTRRHLSRHGSYEGREQGLVGVRLAVADSALDNLALDALIPHHPLAHTGGEAIEKDQKPVVELAREG